MHARAEDLARVRQTLRPTVGDLAPGRGEDTLLAVPVRVPVLRDGELRYVLTAVIAAEAFSEVVARQASGDVEWTRTRVDARGIVVARTRNPARFVGQSATPRVLERTRAANEAVFANNSMEGVRGAAAPGTPCPSPGWSTASSRARRSASYRRARSRARAHCWPSDPSCLGVD